MPCFIGMYMYTKTNHWTRYGDYARLQLAVLRSESPSCLTFYYHMYLHRFVWGKGTFNVYNGNVKIFSKSGNQGNVWKKVTATLHPSDDVSVIIYYTLTFLVISSVSSLLLLLFFLTFYFQLVPGIVRLPFVPRPHFSFSRRQK